MRLTSLCTRSAKEPLHVYMPEMEGGDAMYVVRTMAYYKRNGGAIGSEGRERETEGGRDINGWRI